VKKRKKRGKNGLKAREIKNQRGATIQERKCEGNCKTTKGKKKNPSESRISIGGRKKNSGGSEGKRGHTRGGGRQKKKRKKPGKPENGNYGGEGRPNKAGGFVKGGQKEKRRECKHGKTETGTREKTGGNEKLRKKEYFTREGKMGWARGVKNLGRHPQPNKYITPLQGGKTGSKL